MSKHNVGLKPLLNEGLAYTEFYGKLVCKFRKIADKIDFFVEFMKSSTRYKKKKEYSRHRYQPKH